MWKNLVEKFFSFNNHEDFFYFFLYRQLGAKYLLQVQTWGREATSYGQKESMVTSECGLHLEL